MKTLFITLFLVCITPFMAAAFPGSTNTASVAFTNAPKLSDPDWKWTIYSGEDTVFKVTISDAVDTSDYVWQFRMVSVTGTVITVADADITKSSLTTTWSIYPTNMPPAGTYKSELKAYVGSTNGVRATAGQGFVTIIKSLFE